jgi:hypothetical protein
MENIWYIDPAKCPDSLLFSYTAFGNHGLQYSGLHDNGKMFLGKFRIMNEELSTVYMLNYPESIVKIQYEEIYF